MIKVGIVSLPPGLLGFAAGALGVARRRLRVAALAGDAGSRVYFRVRVDGGQAGGVVAADGDAAQQRRFVALSRAFAEAGVAVPRVRAQAPGFLLLEDFGDVTFWDCLRAEGGEGRVDALMAGALAALGRIQGRARLAAGLPEYGAAALEAEMLLFDEWYCGRHLRRPLEGEDAAAVAAARGWLAVRMLEEAPVPVHRDYHARNLMVLEGEEGVAGVGVLDFQDAVLGSPLYDVVSLLRDAYVAWGEARQEGWLRDYWRAARERGVAVGTLGDCRRAFNVAGAQRGLKVLGIFARLAHRDGKRRYVGDMPIAHRHLLRACAALPELAALGRVVAGRAPVR